MQNATVQIDAKWNTDNFRCKSASSSKVDSSE